VTMPRAHLVDPAVTRLYHCVTRCVRRAFLLSEGPIDRRKWIEQRLQELAEIFAVSVGGFSVMIITCTYWSASTPTWPKTGQTRKSSGAGGDSSHPATSPASPCPCPRPGSGGACKTLSGSPPPASDCKA
jgi:hypothetical protein